MAEVDPTVVSTPIDSVPVSTMAGQVTNTQIPASSYEQLTLWQKFWMVLALIVVIFLSWNVIKTSLISPSPLTVIGTGRKSVKPEEASFVVARANRGGDATSTINEGEAGIKVLMDTVESVIGSGAEIKKSFYQLTPLSAQQFQVVNAFSVKTQEVTRVSELIKSLYQAGATTVTNVSFTSQDKDKTTQEARVLAVKDAREKAKEIAKAAGKRLGKMISITDDNTAASSTVGTTETQSSQSNLDSIEITKQVSVTYEIW